jgi:hypothetical protein
VPFLWEHANSINRIKSVVIPRYLNIKTIQTVLHRHDTTDFGNIQKLTVTYYSMLFNYFWKVYVEPYTAAKKASHLNVP